MFESDQIGAAIRKLMESFDSVNIRPIRLNLEFEADSEFNLESDAMKKWMDDIKDTKDYSVHFEHHVDEASCNNIRLTIRITNID